MDNARCLQFNFRCSVSVAYTMTCHPSFLKMWTLPSGGSFKDSSCFSANFLQHFPNSYSAKCVWDSPQHPHILSKIYWPPETPHLLVSCQGPSKMYSPQEVSQSFEICLSFCLLANNKLDPGAIGQNLFLAQIARDDSIIYDYLYLMAFSYVWCLAGID